MSEQDQPDKPSGISKDTEELAEPKISAKSMLKKGMDVADKATAVVEGAGNVLNAIKWVAIAVVFSLIVFTGFAVYKVVTKPIAAIGGVVDSTGEVIQSGAGAIKDKTVQVLGRYGIPTADQRRLNKVADRAFESLNTMEVQTPDGVGERLFWKTNFGGSENKVCKMIYDFGNGDLDVLAAADNEEFETSKALGANEGRLIRILVRTKKDDVKFIVDWDANTEWQLGWSKTTIKKPVSDEVAAERLFDVLTRIPKACD